MRSFHSFFTKHNIPKGERYFLRKHKHPSIKTMTFKPKHEDKTAFLSVYMRTVVFAPITLEASDKKTLLKAKKLQV